ncbi:hypothetical protein ACHAO8_007005 [Botrytis cinerea]
MPKCLPKDAHYQRMFGEIYRDHFESTGVYYMDLWRMTAISIMQTNTLISARKADPMPRFFKPIVGGPCIFDMPQDSWRPWRAVFNNTFNNEHFQKLVPEIVKPIEVYKDILREHAEKGGMFYLDSATLLHYGSDWQDNHVRLLLLILLPNEAELIRNTDFHAQRGYNVLADSMVSQIRWHEPDTAIDPLSRIIVV